MPFKGEGAGIADMSWGQREIWSAMVGQRSSLPLGGTKPLPSGTTVEDVAEELAYLMGRFPSMRTRLRSDGADGGLVQELFGSGETQLALYEAGDGDPADTASAVERHWRRVDFDHENAWPVRMGVVLKGGAAAYMVVIMSHLVIDGVGGINMLREVEARETAPPTCLQPLEQAQWQASPAGLRQNVMALRHWESSMRSLPQRPLPVSADRREPRHWGGLFHSRALRLAVEAIAERTGTDTSPILLALFAIAVGRVCGISPLAVCSVVNNRFRSGLAEVVGPVAQSGICVLDVAEVTVREAVERARRGSVGANKYAYYDPHRLRELIGRLGEEDGRRPDVDRFFNDRRVDGMRKPEKPAAPTADELREAAAASSFAWTQSQDDPYEKMIIHIDDVPDGVRLFLLTDTHWYAPADIEAIAWTMEDVALEAALDPDAPTGVVRAGE